MNVKISFKHMPHSAPVEAKIKDKCSKLAKCFDGMTSIEWTCYEKEGSQWSDVKISGPKFVYHATAGAPNLYKSFDMILDKLGKQVKRKKGKMSDKDAKHGPKSHEHHPDADMAWALHDENKFDDVG